MPATLLNLRTGIVDGIKAELTSLRTCRAYHGELDEDELARAYQPAPAVMVVCTGVRHVRLEGSTSVAEAVWSAFVLTEGVKVDKRDDEALALVTALLQTIPTNRWGVDGARRAEDVSAQSLYSGTTDRKALSMWAVSWRQAVELPPEVDVTALEDFARLYADHDLAPADGTVDASDHVVLETAP